jgi:hypothetical protein
MIKGERTEFRNDVNTLLGDLVEGTTTSSMWSGSSVLTLQTHDTHNQTKHISSNAFDFSLFSCWYVPIDLHGHLNTLPAIPVADMKCIIAVICTWMDMMYPVEQYVREAVELATSYKSKNYIWSEKLGSEISCDIVRSLNKSCYGSVHGSLIYFLLYSHSN